MIYQNQLIFKVNKNCIDKLRMRNETTESVLPDREKN